MSDTPETEAAKARRLGRSPAYPSFSIAKGLDNAKALYAQEKEYAAPLGSALKAFGYSPKSSGGRQALATMKYYGLIEVNGEGDARRIKVSDAALKILRDPREDETEKRQLIREVAMAPAAHKMLHQEYPNGLASDGTVLYFLHGQGFNESAARELLAEFKETASFIRLYEPQKAVDKGSAKDDSGNAGDGLPIAVGDVIQWVIDGVEQFAGGATVEVIHPSGSWLWVSEKLTKSGIPMEQVELLERGKADPAAAPPRPGGPARQVLADDPAPDPTKKPKVTLDDDVMTIIASVKMAELPSLKKKIEALEAFYNAE